MGSQEGPRSCRTGAALLRIAQGAIANVIQHAHATTATITLAVDREQVQLTIVDDGTGFDPEQVAGTDASHSDSFGLQAARERVEQLDGVLTIQSAPQAGTALTVVLAAGGGA